MLNYIANCLLIGLSVAGVLALIAGGLYLAFDLYRETK